MMKRPQDLIRETLRKREEAERLLKSLMSARTVSERNLADLHQPDLMKQVSGNSSIENAIAATRKLIESFNRVIDDLRASLSPEDVALIGC